MDWRKRLISEEELPPYLSGGEAHMFEARVRALLAQQQATWPMLHDAVAAFDQVKYKSFNVSGSKVLAQFNPARIVSAGAKVDAATIGQRPCFLCPDNLPTEEKGVAF